MSVTEEILAPEQVPTTFEGMYSFLEMNYGTSDDWKHALSLADTPERAFRLYLMIGNEITDGHPRFPETTAAAFDKALELCQTKQDVIEHIAWNYFPIHTNDLLANIDQVEKLARRIQELPDREA